MSKPTSQKRRLAIGSSARVTLRVLNIFVALALTPFIITTLGDEDYGLWTVVAAFLGYYDLLDLGIGSSVSRYVSASMEKRDDEETNRLLSTAMGIYCVIAGIIVVVTLLLAGGAYWLDFPQGEGGPFAHMILLLGMVQAIVVATRVYSGVLTADLRFDLQSLFQFIAMVIRTGVIIVLLLTGFGVLSMAYASAGTYLLVLFLPIFTVWRMHPFIRIRPWRVTRDKVKQIFSYSIFSFISSLSQAVRFRIDAVVIAALMPGAAGLVAVAHYSIAAMLINNFRIGMDAMFGVLFPYFSRVHATGDQAKMKRMLFFAIRRATQVAMFVGAALILWGHDFIIAWIRKADYAAAYPCLVILTVGTVVVLSQFPSYHYLFGISKNRFTAVINTIEAAMNLGLTLLLIKPFGIVGVAMGTAIPLMLIQCTALPIYTARQLGVSLSAYALNLLRGLSVSLVALLPAALIAYEWSQPSLLWVTVQGAAGFALYLIGLWLIENLIADKQQRRSPLRWMMAVPEQA